MTPRRPTTSTAAGWRGTAAGPVVAGITLVVAALVTGRVGLTLRDPDHVAALYFVVVGCGVAGMVGLDILLRARASCGSFPPPRAALGHARRERWTLRRGLVVGSALLGFYLTYMAYRNLKSVVPLFRPELFDRQLAELDRSLFGGNDPAALLHAVLGTGVTTHVLSSSYVIFIVFLPLTIGVALVFLDDLRAGLFYTTAQSVNWLLGAASYFLLPSLGPIYADPAAFARLPFSEVTRLQGVLLDQRIDFLRDPAAATPQSIAAFASLHISMSLTAAVAAHLLGLGRRLRIGLWTWFAVTTLATVYLGWHYVLDDVGGVVLAVMALALARVLCGTDLRTGRLSRRAPGAVQGDGRAAGARPAAFPVPHPAPAAGAPVGAQAVSAAGAPAGARAANRGSSCGQY